MPRTSRGTTRKFRNTPSGKVPRCPVSNSGRSRTGWRAHLDAAFNLDKLATRAGLSNFHFHRLFKQATGVSPAKYQLNARMDEARRRLRETKQSIITVASDVGYSSPSHFAQVFRRETRMTPSEYRRQR